MAVVIQINKTRFIWIVAALFALFLVFLVRNQTRTPSKGLYQLEGARIPYKKMHPCNSLSDCPDIRLSANTTLRRIELVLIRLLRVFDLVCKKHGLQWFVYKGTLLGAARHKGYNPFDNDIDIVILREDYAKFSAVIQRELPPDIFFQTEQTDPFYKKPTISYMEAKLRDTKSCYVDYLSTCADKCLQNGLQVDISVLPTDKNGNLVDLFSSEKLWRRYLQGPLVMKRENVFPLVSLEYEGFSLPVPNKWQRLLEFWYGHDYMNIPYNRPILTGSHIDPLQSCDQVKKHRHS